MVERIKKLNELLKEELSALILKEVEFHCQAFVTILGVNTSKDLHYAKVYVSIFPLENSQKVLNVMRRINIQKFLYKRLSIKTIPQFQFIIDDTDRRASEIEQLLDRIKKTG